MAGGNTWRGDHTPPFDRATRALLAMCISRQIGTASFCPSRVGCGARITHPATITERSTSVDVDVSLLNTGAVPVIIVGAFISSADPVRASMRESYQASSSSSQRSLTVPEGLNSKIKQGRLLFNRGTPLPVGKQVSHALTMRVTAKRAGLYSGKIVIMTNESNPAQARIDCMRLAELILLQVGKAALQSGLISSLGTSIDGPTCRGAGWGTHYLMVCMLSGGEHDESL